MISGAVGPGDHEAHSSSIWLVSILGGTPRRLRGDAVRAMLSPDDSLIAYMSEDGIWLVDADGENPREFVEARDWESVGAPAWSPDGKRILYHRVAPAGKDEVTTIESRGLDETTSTVLVSDTAGRLSSNVFAKDFLMLGDRLIYTLGEPPPRKRDGNLWELAIDRRTGKPKGEPRRLTDWVGFGGVSDLSVTVDGSKLALRSIRGQSDVYVGELGAGGRSLDGVRRLTLDDRDDLPCGWTPDGRAVVFQSDRYGNEDLFVQDIDRRDARDLATGAGDQRSPHLTPDGASFLYWESPEDASGRHRPRKLLRIPAAGGPTELVLETEHWAEVDCATLPDGPCVLLEVWPQEQVATVSRLDPVGGKGEELGRFDLDPEVDPRGALSPDGTRYATVGHTKDYRSIRLWDTFTAEILRDVEVDGLQGMDFMDVEWSPDGAGFYVIGDSPRGVALLRVDLDGAAHVLHEDLTGNFYLVKPSPDGRHLAFGKETDENNAWMIEQF